MNGKSAVSNGWSRGILIIVINPMVTLLPLLTPTLYDVEAIVERFQFDGKFRTQLMLR